MLAIVAAVFALLALSSFFSLSEAAFNGASRPLMRHLDDRGDRRAGRALRLLSQPERLQDAISLGNTLVIVLASSLATRALIARYGDAGVPYATAAVTLLALVFGETLPRLYATRRANQVALAFAPLTRAMVLASWPITRPVEALARSTLRLAGVDPRRRGAAGSAGGELRGAIALHQGDGLGDAAPDPGTAREERAMLHSVLDLSTLEIGKVMTHRRNVVMIDAADPPEAVVAQVLDSPYSRFPIWLGAPDNVVGVVHAKALLRAAHVRGGRIDENDVMEASTKPWFAPNTTTLLDQLRAFRERREHFALVVDEYGVLMGIVTLEDILEEIVGEIADEHDPTAAGAVLEPGGGVVAQGVVSIRELNREFGWRLPEEEAVTVAGLVLREARRIPEVGQSFRFHGFRFDVLRKHRHQITAIRITPATEHPVEDGGAAS